MVHLLCFFCFVWTAGTATMGKGICVKEDVDVLQN